MSNKIKYCYNSWIPCGVVAHVIDFGASASGFEARLCHLIFYLSGIECCYSTLFLAIATQITLLGSFGLQYSISKKTRAKVSLSSMQGVFAESLLRKQAWRNPKEGRVGSLHQNIFTRKVTDIAFTSDFCNQLFTSRVPCPCIWRPLIPVPHIPASHAWCPQVPRLTSPSPKSPHTRPDVPVPLSPSHFYTQPKWAGL